MTAPKRTAMRKTLLDAVTLNARALRDTERTLNNLMCRAVERGIPQTTVAKAAGVSQAHVSRTVAANRRANEARKAARRSKRTDEGRPV
jgi:hypothetical protein